MINNAAEVVVWLPETLFVVFKFVRFINVFILSIFNSGVTVRER